MCLLQTNDFAVFIVLNVVFQNWIVHSRGVEWLLQIAQSAIIGLAVGCRLMIRDCVMKMHNYYHFLSFLQENISLSPDQHEVHLCGALKGALPRLLFLNDRFDVRSKLHILLLVFKRVVVILSWIVLHEDNVISEKTLLVRLIWWDYVWVCNWLKKVKIWNSKQNKKWN